MSQERVIKLESDMAEVKSDLKEVTELLKESQNQAVETQKSMGRATKAMQKFGKGIKGVGLALKALGIGLILEAFALFKDILGQNQKAADFFAAAFGTVSEIFTDFVSLAIESLPKIRDYLMEVLQDPLKPIKDLGNAIYEYLQEPIQKFTDGLGILGESIRLFFQGEWSAAAEVASAGFSKIGEAGKDAYNQIKEDTIEVIEQGKEYVGNLYDQAAALQDLTNQARIAQAVNRGLIEQYDRQAEQQRQIRDDETKTFEQRIEANRRLGEILDLQEKKLLENAQLEVARAAEEIRLYGENIDRRVALIDAENELKAIQATVAGLRSEQLINEIQLEREVNDKLKERKELLNEQKELLQENQEAITEALLSPYEQEENAIFEKYAKLIEMEGATNEQILALRKQRDAELDAMADKQREEQNQADINAWMNKYDAAQQIAGAAFGAIGQLAGENAQMAKGIAIAETIWNTASAIIASIKTLGLPAGLPGAIAAGAMGAAQLATILRTNPERGGGGGSITQPRSGGVAFSPTAAILDDLPYNQIQQAINFDTTPMKAYVVSGDVTTQQALDRKILQNATFK